MEPKAAFIRGRLKGQTLPIGQYCNDWVMIDGRAVGLSNVQFNDYAVDQVLRDKQYDEEHPEGSRLGMMFDIFDYEHFVETGRFKRRIKNGR